MNLDELQDSIREAIAPAFRDRLLAKGQARSMIWRDGVLPAGAPRFPRNLSYDLQSYAYALLSMALRVREEGGEQALYRAAFEHAADALEAVIAKGRQDDPTRGFHRLLSASAFHLGRFSARAFSLLVGTLESSNLTPMERALALFILRGFDELERLIADWCLGSQASDDQIIAQIEQDAAAADDGAEVPDDEPYLDGVDLALTQQFMRGLGAFLLALESGEASLVEVARAELIRGFESCKDLNLVP